MTIYEALQAELDFRIKHNNGPYVNKFETDLNKWDEDDWSEIEHRMFEAEALPVTK